MSNWNAVKRVQTVYVTAEQFSGSPILLLLSVVILCGAPALAAGKFCETRNTCVKCNSRKQRKATKRE